MSQALGIDAVLPLPVDGFGLFRRRDLQAGADRESVRPESVTYVLGMNCHPCDRNRSVLPAERVPDQNSAFAGTAGRHSAARSILRAAIREERAVILSDGPTLTVSRGEFEASTAPTSVSVTLEDVERDHVLRALEQTGWVIGGAHGAAARLGLKRARRLCRRGDGWASSDQSQGQPESRRSRPLTGRRSPGILKPQTSLAPGPPRRRFARVVNPAPRDAERSRAFISSRSHRITHRHESVTF